VGLPIHVVDAFTERPFSGNPAAVCLLDTIRDVKWMQSVAAEMNLSETAFLRRDGARWNLRWFTPTTEVELCGHATLASAHVLFERHESRQVRFDTKSGELTAVREQDRIRLDFPRIDSEPADLPDLGFPIVAASRGDLYTLAELESEEQVRNLQPDLDRIRETVGCLIVTAAASTALTTHRLFRGEIQVEIGKYAFVSRFFGPAVGVDEDPVTGSAHCMLAPYWAEKLGSTELRGYQASARGGIVHTRLVGDRVHLIGSAVTVTRGELFC